MGYVDSTGFAGNLFFNQNLIKNWLQGFDKTKYILFQSKWDNQKAENISGWKMSPMENTKIKNIDHLWIVAG